MRGRALCVSMVSAPLCPLRAPFVCMLGSPSAGRVLGGSGIPQLSSEQAGVGPEFLGLQGQGF